jgi:hypothetical protein
MSHRSDKARCRDLQSDAHLPEVQGIIRGDIQNGTIRVRPKPEGGILIVPTGRLDDVEVRAVEASPVQSQTENNPLRRAVRRHKLARH